MYAEERRIKIMQILADEKTLHVRNLARLFAVSGATIRSDLRTLELAGKLTRTHGGAIAEQGTGFESDIAGRSGEHLAEKRQIAQIALKQIEDGDTIALDTGTTILELAQMLSQRRRLTVVTNDLVVAKTLETAPDIQIILLGGIVRKGFHCTIGSETIKQTATEQLSVDKAFMATNGFTLQNGATTPDIRQAEAKKRLIAMANRIFLLCDCSKLGKVAFAQFAAAGDIDVLITNELCAAERHAFAEHSIQTLVAEN